jgi:hypothetical protein
MTCKLNSTMRHFVKGMILTFDMISYRSVLTAAILSLLGEPLGLKPSGFSKQFSQLDSNHLSS